MLVMGTDIKDNTKILLEVMCVEYEPSQKCIVLFDTDGDEWFVHNVSEVEFDEIILALYKNGKYFFGSFQQLDLIDDCYEFEV